MDNQSWWSRWKRWCHAETKVTVESDGLVECLLQVYHTQVLIFDEGTVDHSYYIKNVLLVALKYGNEVFGDNWIFQQDGANPHRHHLTQQWCSLITFHHLLTRIVGLQTVQIWILCTTSIWNELINVIDRNKVRWKTTLIQQLRLSDEKNSENHLS